MEYKATSGSLTIQLADHLFKFDIIKVFIKDLSIPKKSLDITHTF